MSTWSGVAQAYRDSFASLCAGTEPSILDDLAPGPLLDVGSGSGSLTRAARLRGMNVTAVDADPDMVALTNHVAPGACTLQALPDLHFPPGCFPSVAANFVVNHLSDPRAGVRELARVTAPGGRLVMTIWPLEATEWMSFALGAFEQAGAAPLPSATLPAHLDFPRTVEGLATLARDAGLTVITAHRFVWQWVVTTDSLWKGISGGVARLGACYQAQPTRVQRTIKEAFHAMAQDEAADGVLSFDCAAIYVMARR